MLWAIAYGCIFTFRIDDIFNTSEKIWYTFSSHILDGQMDEYHMILCTSSQLSSNLRKNQRLIEEKIETIKIFQTFLIYLIPLAKFLLNWIYIVKLYIKHCFYIIFFDCPSFLYIKLYN